MSVGVCKKAIERSTWVLIQCPECGSDDVTCEHSEGSHVHHCNACGLHDDAPADPE